MNARLWLFALAVSTPLGVCCGQASAQQLKLLVDRQSGNLSLTGADATVVDFAAYAIQSTQGTLVPLSWDGIRDTELDWEEGGELNANLLTELNSNGNPLVGAVVDNTIVLDMGDGAYNPAVLPALPLGEDAEDGDLSLSYYNQVVDQSLTGLVEFVGEKIFNNIGITVDLANGRAYLENESPNNLTITGYLIESTAGAILNTNGGTFTGLTGFQSPSPLDGENIGQLDSSGSGRLLNSSTALNVLGIDLGVVVDPGSLDSAFDALDFSFILSGVGEVSREGFVKFINVPDGLLGDFNGDGMVDVADYTVWRDNLGAPTEDALANGSGDGMNGVDVGDYLAWRNNFGMGSGAAVTLSPTALAAPEPAAAALVLLSATLLGGMRGRRLTA